MLLIILFMYINEVLLHIQVVLSKSAFTYTWQRGGLERRQCCLDDLTLCIGSFNLHHVKLILCAGVHAGLKEGGDKNTSYSIRHRSNKYLHSNCSGERVPFWDRAGVPRHRLQGWTSHPFLPPAPLLKRTFQVVGAKMSALWTIITNCMVW